jgi:1-aminocyclopropane-1-carboxylate deaminase/D-cysteine desulfhydrase-like pyridoxal-dependent ACC family enzyme
MLDHDRFGDGYGAPTDACREALDLAARLEGLILDPVYTGKAMAGLIAARREGRLAADEQVVFLHTGGMPALFAARYATWIAGPTS